jgi:hypothetical protein
MTSIEGVPDFFHSPNPAWRSVMLPKEKIIECAKVAEQERQHGNFTAALYLFDTFRKGIKVDGVQIESWWDSHSRNYITTFDPDESTGLHYASAFDGIRNSAATAFIWAIIAAASHEEYD